MVLESLLLENDSMEINIATVEEEIQNTFDDLYSKETNLKTNYYPYESMPSLLLHQWWKTEGSTCSKTGFNSLCKLLKKMVQTYPNYREWPSSVHNLERPLEIPKVG